METKRGLFIVIDGGNGAGKGANVAPVASKLHRLGFPVVVTGFPRYTSPAGRLVRMYLDGKFGNLSPEDASVLFALDRLAAKAEIEAWLASGTNVICDRYVASNLAYQGAKIDDEQARAAYIRNQSNYEYGTLGIPRPDLNIIIGVDAAVRTANVDKRGEAKDIHEQDPTLEEKVERVYREIAVTLPNFRLVNCMAADGTQLPVETCNDLVWNALSGLFVPAMTTNPV